MCRESTLLLATANDKAGVMPKETDAMAGHIYRLHDHDGMSLMRQGQSAGLSYRSLDLE